jgi:hypothetical protein
MFRILKASTDRLGPAAVTSLGKHVGKLLASHGFDSNDLVEGRMGAYARYLLETDRSTDLAKHFRPVPKVTPDQQLSQVAGCVLARQSTDGASGCRRSMSAP